MSNQLILVLNCGSSSLKGAVIDRKNGKVLLSCLGERLGTPEAVITFSKDGKKCQTALTGRNDHAGAVGMLLKELEKHGLHDRIKAIGHRIAIFTAALDSQDKRLIREAAQELQDYLNHMDDAPWD